VKAQSLLPRAVIVPLVLLLAATELLPAAESAPCIYWASDPVRPDEVVLLMGEGLGAGAAVEMSSAEGRESASRQWTAVATAQAGRQSVKGIVPADWKQGVYACRVRVGDAVSNELLVNAPDPWWWIGDGGEFATPGGEVRVFGKSLNFGAKGQVRLRSADGRVIECGAEADAYALRFSLPGDLEPGQYAMVVHNGLAGEAAWRDAGTLVVRQPDVWMNEVFNIKDFGPRPGEALVGALQKAAENGGGIVFLPRGRYPVKDRLVIPPRTVLRGEGMELVSLYWPDLDNPPPELVSGADFGIESVSLCCQNHKNVIADTPFSQGMFLHKVRVRANCYFMIEDVGKEFRGRHAPASHKQCGAAVLLRGKNFKITDCDFYASNYALRILKAKTGLIARNRMLYGGRGYSIENTERLIFEGNVVSGDNLLAIGNDITTFWTNSCRHIYFARNRLQQMFGADREMMTLDAAGGAYYGRIAAVDGTHLTLAADPVFRDYAPKPHTDWTGAVVQILDGKGAGQYRFVTAHSGREWEVDRPWMVPPDKTSRISIAPFRGRNLFVENSLEDGGAFQLYGAAHDTIVAGNRGARMDGFLVWGLNPHGWGQQPSWGCQFLDNEILEGNGYGHRSATFSTISGDDPKVYDGPLVRGAIFRRNALDNNARIVLGGTTEDAIVEHCDVRNSDLGVDVKPTTRGVLLWGNRFENVVQPVVGPESANLIQ
jgi:hypothetical protein